MMPLPVTPKRPTHASVTCRSASTTPVPGLRRVASRRRLAARASGSIAMARPIRDPGAGVQLPGFRGQDPVEGTGYDRRAPPRGELSHAKQQVAAPADLFAKEDDRDDEDGYGEVEDAPAEARRQA